MITTFQTLVTDNIEDIVTLLVAVVTAVLAIWAGFLGLRVALKKAKSHIK